MAIKREKEPFSKRIGKLLLSLFCEAFAKSSSRCCLHAVLLCAGAAFLLDLQSVRLKERSICIKSFVSDVHSLLIAAALRENGFVLFAEMTWQRSNPS